MNANAPPVLTIDGPAAAGKGTVAKLLAQKLGFHYLDSGKLYRAVGALAMAQEISPTDENAVCHVAEELADYHERDLLALLAAEEISREAAGKAASELAVFASVRRALLPCQRRWRRPPGLVADGRDMATKVFPDAVMKIYLDADLLERARRRHKQLLQEQGVRGTIEDVFADLKRRDERDAARAESPMQKSSDSLVVNSSGQTPQKIAEYLVQAYGLLSTSSATDFYNQNKEIVQDHE